jgi:hypothetical protein
MPDQVRRASAQLRITALLCLPLRRLLLETQRLKLSWRAVYIRWRADLHYNQASGVSLHGPKRYLDPQILFADITRLLRLCGQEYFS